METVVKARATHTLRRAGLGPRGAARSLGVEPLEAVAGQSRRDFAGAIGHVMGHLKEIGKASRDRAAGVGVLLLLGDGAVRVEADCVELLVGGAIAMDSVLIRAWSQTSLCAWCSMARAWAAMLAAYLWRMTRSLSVWCALTCAAGSAAMAAACVFIIILWCVV